MHKQYEEVLDLSQRAIQLDPNHALAHTSKARALYELKRYEEALASCELALQLNPTLAQAHAYKGRALSQLNRFEEALAPLDEAIRLDPGLAKALTGKATVLGLLERYEEALAIFECAIELDPDDSAAYNNKGVTFNHLERYEEALICFDRVIQLTPDDALAYHNKGATWAGYGTLKHRSFSTTGPFNSILIIYRPIRIKPLPSLRSSVLKTRSRLSTRRSRSSLMMLVSIPANFSFFASSNAMQRHRLHVSRRTARNKNIQGIDPPECCPAECGYAPKPGGTTPLLQALNASNGCRSLDGTGEVSGGDIEMDGETAHSSVQGARFFLRKLMYKPGIVTDQKIRVADDGLEERYIVIRPTESKR